MKKRIKIINCYKDADFCTLLKNALNGRNINGTKIKRKDV